MKHETMEWQWHQLGHMQIICTLLQTPVPHHSDFLQAGCPFCRPTNHIKALMASAKTKYAVKTTTGDSEDESVEAVPA